MNAGAQTERCDAQAGHCITCSDEGIPMQVLRAGPEFAECRDEAGDRHQVATDLIAGVGVGATVLVHAGVAIGLVST